MPSFANTNVFLAVEADAQRAVSHRLGAGGAQVDDREPAVGEPGAPIVRDPQTGVVGSAPDHRVADGEKLALVDRRCVRAVGVDAGDPAHQATALLSIVRLTARQGKVTPCGQGFALRMGFCHSTGGNSACSKEFRDG